MESDRDFLCDGGDIVCAQWITGDDGGLGIGGEVCKNNCSLD